jgi:uncharacterized protein YdeI (YjbR/CyaY-like superfamily)
MSASRGRKMADRQSKSAVAKLPEAVVRALAGHAEARAAFEQLPASHKQEYVKWIVSAKKPETVARRLRQLIPMLLAKKSKGS